MSHVHESPSSFKVVPQWQLLRNVSSQIGKRGLMNHQEAFVGLQKVRGVLSLLTGQAHII